MHGYQKQTPSTPARELYIGAIRKGNNGKFWKVVQRKRGLLWVQNVPNPKKRKVPLKNRSTRKKNYLVVEEILMKKWNLNQKNMIFNIKFQI